MDNAKQARKLLSAWYAKARRDLPWRKTRDPWRILVSEVMLQQTRVNAVLPYYERFLARFPDPRTLAAAGDQELLALWSGLGYYTRARNLKKAAETIAARGSFPATHDEIRALAGVGDYTAAAIASIAFGLPHAVLDGNVLRVLSRVAAERGDINSSQVRVRLREAAQRLLDSRRPGDANQALMELGATVCLPRNPQCLLCPWRDFCRARAEGIQAELPIKGRRREPVKLAVALVVAQRGGSVLLRQRGPAEKRLAGFWELPEKRDLPNAKGIEPVGSFRHSITRHDYAIEVLRAKVGKAPRAFVWWPTVELAGVPLATTARKALELAGVIPLPE